MESPVQLDFQLIRRIRLIQLGKYGAFPSKQLLGLHYDITYEITTSSETAAESAIGETFANETSGNQPAFGQSRGKKRKSKKGQSLNQGSETVRTNPGWRSVLRPLKRQPLVNAILGELWPISPENNAEMFGSFQMTLPRRMSS